MMSFDDRQLNVFGLVRELAVYEAHESSMGSMQDLDMTE
jgi:hypothetical protein